MPTRVSLYMKPDIMPSTYASNSIRQDSSSNTLTGAYINFLGSDLNSYPCGRDYVGIIGTKAVQYCSRYVSDENCEFDTIPWYRWTFPQTVTSRGITIFYRNAWLKPHTVRLTWLDSSDNELDVKTFTFDEAMPEGIQGGESTYQYCENYVENFLKLKVEFLKTWLPYQSIYMVDVSTSDVTVFNDEQVLTAECDLIDNAVMDTLETGTATVSIHDPDDLFNPQNMNGRWNDLDELESLIITELDENNNPILQTYWFLDTFDWEDSVLTLNAIDCVGKLERSFFPGVDYDEVTYQGLLTRLHDFTDLRAYSMSGLSATVFNQVSVANTNCKEFLQNIFCAMGVEMHRHYRRRYYMVYPPDGYTRLNLYPERKFLTRLKFAEQTNGINLEIPTSSDVEAESEVFINQYFDVGKYLVNFGDIYRAVTITGATDITGAAYNCFRRIEVTTAGTVTFSGRKLTANYSTYSQPIVEKADSADFKTIRLICRCESKQTDAIEKLAKHYSNRQLLTVDAKLNYAVDVSQPDMSYWDYSSDMPGKWCKVVDVKGLTAYARIEKVHVDFVGGMLGEIELRGYSRQVVDNLRMIEDAYTMDDNPLM